MGNTEMADAIFHTSLGSTSAPSCIPCIARSDVGFCLPWEGDGDSQRRAVGKWPKVC